jgi:cytochrome c biogenesis protein ResB
MATPIGSATTERTTVRERAADALRQAAHFSHEARLLKTLATDAVEDGLHTAERTIKRARQTALDARDDVTYRVKREPIKALALVFGAGAMFGLIVGLARRRAKAQADKEMV